MNKATLDHVLLPDEEIRSLVAAYQEGDQAAGERVIAHNERLIYDIAAHYYHARVTGDVGMEDLMQLGRMGILRAMRKFDPRKPVKFSTYAWHWIRQSIRRHGMRAGQGVTMSYHATDTRGRIGVARAAFEQANGREPTVAELAAATGNTESALARLRVYTVSLDDPGDQTRELAERIPDPAIDVEGDAQERVDAQKAMRTLSTLPATWQTVITMRYGLGGKPPASLREIARTLRISGERARQIEQAALLRMRDSAE